jgi:hypothetical protein
MPRLPSEHSESLLPSETAGAVKGSGLQADLSEAAAALKGSGLRNLGAEFANSGAKVLSLLALLVQKYKY